MVKSKQLIKHAGDKIHELVMVNSWLNQSKIPIKLFFHSLADESCSCDVAWVYVTSTLKIWGILGGNPHEITIQQGCNFQNNSPLGLRLRSLRSLRDVLGWCDRENHRKNHGKRLISPMTMVIFMGFIADLNEIAKFFNNT